MNGTTTTTMTTMNDLQTEHHQALYWHGQCDQAQRRAEQLERELTMMRAAFAAQSRRVAAMIQTLIDHGLPVPPPTRTHHVE